MWPTTDRFDEVLRSGNRRWATRVELLYAGDLITSLDVVVDGRVDVDEVAVRRSLNIELVDPTGTLTPATASDLLSPKGTEARVWKGLLVDGEYEWVPLGVFGVVDPEVSAHEGGTRVTFRGFDRVGAVRVRRFTAPWNVATGTLTHVAMGDIVTSRITVPTRITASGYTTPELVFDRLSDPWDAVREIGNADLLEAYFDQLGTLVITDETEALTGVTYEPGATSLLLGSTRGITAEHTYSGVIVSVEHPERDPIIAEAWDTDPKSVTYYLGPFGKRPFGFSSPVITTQAQAQAAANTLLKRVTKMRQTATLTTVGHPGHEIGDVIEVIDPKTRTKGLWRVIGAQVPLRPGLIKLKLEEALGG